MTVANKLLWTALLLSMAGMSGCAVQSAKLLAAGDDIELIEEAESPVAAPDAKLLLLAVDGIDRKLLYQMLEAGELPELAQLLGGGGSGRTTFSHAYFEDSLLSALPSSTAVAWATLITGVEPAHHGIVGNEYFIRGSREFAAPVPVSVSAAEPVLRIYTEGYADELLEAPTVYQQLRASLPDLSVWVGMHQFHGGANRLILTDRTAMLNAFEGLFKTHLLEPLTGETSLGLFRTLDEEIVENIGERLEEEPAPDILTVYLPGLDHYAHVAETDPDTSRRQYLLEGLEPLWKSLREKLAANGALDNRYVMLVSDHGHTQVLQDDAHSLGMDGEGEPAQVLEAAGFTPRPFRIEVDEDRFFDTVLAYQGAMAYVHAADKSTCANSSRNCNWAFPARVQDVNAVAEAFHSNNLDGLLVPEMRGALDMVLVRRQPPTSRAQDIFEVYLGGGTSQPLSDYLEAHPHPDYVDMPQRLHGLTAGPHGDRVGDVILVANNGNRKSPDERFYFAGPYSSWHGSPSKRDSEVPLILAHPGQGSAELKARVEQALNGSNGQRRVTNLIIQLMTEADAAPAQP